MSQSPYARQQRMIRLTNEAIVEMSDGGTPRPKMVAWLTELRDQMSEMPWTAQDYSDLMRIIEDGRRRTENIEHWTRRGRWVLPVWGAFLTLVNTCVVVAAFYISLHHS